MKKLAQLISVFKYINEHPLAGRHRFTAYSKFLQWQVEQLVSPGEKIMPFIAKSFLSIDKGMTGATGNIYLGLHDFYEMSFLLHFLTEGDLFADIGANIGSYSILASGVKGAKTIAFEPSLKTYTQLQKNILLNHQENNIKAYNLALGSKVDKLFFTTALDTVNHVVPDYEIKNNKNGAEVNVDTLDAIVKEHQVPILIKIDVEGFETEVINGMEKTLADNNLKAIVIELNGSGMRYGYNEADIHDKLVLHGFQPYSYDPFSRTFEINAGFGSHNTLYLRDLPFVRDRTGNAAKVSVFNEKF